MKINPDSLILEKFEFKENIGFFLINGNEDTYIEKIYTTIIKNLNCFGYDEIIKFSDTLVNYQNMPEVQNGSLFSNKKILVFKNIKNFDFDIIKKLKDANNVIIIIDNKIKNTSKIKRFFDADNECASITCYKLSKESKKNIAQYIFSQNNIKVENDGFWYFLDQTEDRYLLYENEIFKIVNFNKPNIVLNDIILLTSNKNSEDIDGLFFSILTSQKSIIQQTLASINSSTDGYILIQRIKFYINLLSKTSNIDEANQILPKYLFMQKQKFISIYKKITPKKLLSILALLKKTEIMLRKNNGMYLPIIQRFLLNLRSSIN